MVQLRKIRHSFKDRSNGNKRLVWRDLSLDVPQGEIVSLLGPSGCGKTTLVNILAGFISPSSGEVWFGDKNLTGRPTRDRVVINQQYDLFDWMTAIDNVALACSGREEARRYLELTRLGDFSRHFPGQLSGGMQKRLSLARALAANPRFLIIDEAFASLDFALKEQLHVELMRLYLSGDWSIFLVTHDIEEALFLSSRILVASSGPAEIVEEVLVPFSYPRLPELKEAKEFVEMRSSLRSRMEGSAAAPSETIG